MKFFHENKLTLFQIPLCWLLFSLGDQQQQQTGAYLPVISRKAAELTARALAPQFI